MIRALVAILCLSACATAPKPALDIHASWSLTEIDGRPTQAELRPSIAFQTDGNVQGHRACNGFYGPYRVEGREIVFDEWILSTLVACTHPGVDMDRHHAESEQFRIVMAQGPVRLRQTSEGDLILIGSNGVRLRFARSAVVEPPR